MIEIKFRAFDIIGKKWVYGDLVHNHKVTQTGVTPRVMVGGYEVDPETAGQFTGLHDKNGKEIYEGDIVELRQTIGELTLCEVSMCDKGYWCITFGICERVILGLIDRKIIKIIGNIHDNPELIN